MFGYSWCFQLLCTITAFKLSYQSCTTFTTTTSAAFEATANSSSNSSCPTGWTAFNRSCYFIYATGMNHNRAQAYCRSLKPSSYLADITSQEEFDWLITIVESPVWLGATSAFGFNFTWLSDGSKIDQNSSWWNTGEPNNSGGKQFCLILFLSNEKIVFDDSACNNSFFPLCKMQGTDLDKIQSTSVCPSDWHSENQSCYKIYSKDMTHCQAQAFCQSQANNAYLADIKNEMELEFIASIVKTDSVWFGATSAFGYDFTWLHDGSSLSRNSPWWKSGEPNFKNSNEYCLMIRSPVTDIHALNDEKCNTRLKPLCKIQK